MKRSIYLLSFILFTFMMSAQNKEARIKVQISTTMGDMVVELYNETPVHRDNFLELVGKNFYDSLLFHRCIKTFMIQGGDPESLTAEYGKVLGGGDLGYTLPAEIRPDLVHVKGALCAARMGDNVNPEKRSSGCQFYLVQGQRFTESQLESFSSRRRNGYTAEQKQEYINMGGTPHLDGNYTVFGRVVSGLEVLEAISLIQTDQNDRPIKDIRMKVQLIK